MYHLHVSCLQMIVFFIEKLILPLMLLSFKMREKVWKMKFNVENVWY